jgi:hypothetical protein
MTAESKNESSISGNIARRCSYNIFSNVPPLLLRILAVNSNLPSVVHINVVLKLYETSLEGI